MIKVWACFVSPMTPNPPIAAKERDDLHRMLQHAIDLLVYIQGRLTVSPEAELSNYYNSATLLAKPSASIRGLRQKIKDLLAQAQRPLRSADITDALYHPSMGISRDKFNRKVIVAVSAMFNEDKGEVKKVVMEGREALWAIGDLDLEKLKAQQQQLNLPSPKKTT
jgi:hypothetical protein